MGIYFFEGPKLGYVCKRCTIQDVLCDSSRQDEAYRPVLNYLIDNLTIIERNTLFNNNPRRHASSISVNVA